MREKDFKKPLIKLMKKIFLEKTHVVRDGTLTFIYIMELELIFAVKKQRY